VIPIAILAVTPFATHAGFAGNRYTIVVSCDSDGNLYSASTITFLGHAYYALCPPNSEDAVFTHIVSSASGVAVIVLYAGGNTYSHVETFTPSSGCTDGSITGPGFTGAAYVLDALCRD
jgi:hypothetical protein